MSDFFCKARDRTWLWCINSIVLFAGMTEMKLECALRRTGRRSNSQFSYDIFGQPYSNLLTVPNQESNREWQNVARLQLAMLVSRLSEQH